MNTAFGSLEQEPRACRDENGAPELGPDVRFSLSLSGVPTFDGYIVQIKSPCGVDDGPVHVGCRPEARGRRRTSVTTRRFPSRHHSHLCRRPLLLRIQCTSSRLVRNLFAKPHRPGSTTSMKQEMTPVLWTPGAVLYGAGSQCPTVGSPLSTRERPRWWLPQETAATPDTRHFLSVRWRCCCGRGGDDTVAFDFEPNLPDALDRRYRI